MERKSPIASPRAKVSRGAALQEASSAEALDDVDPFAFPDDEPLEPIVEDDVPVEEGACVEGPEEDTPKSAAKEKPTRAELFAAAKKKAATQLIWSKIAARRCTRPGFESTQEVLCMGGRMWQRCSGSASC